MPSKMHTLVQICSLLAIIPLGLAAEIVESSYPRARVIEKDVAILGGGASGSHAAVRLREDLKKSVVVVEKNGRLGGHVSTYTEPNTGAPMDYGVQSYIHYKGALDFFLRFNLTNTTYPASKATTNKYVDFSNGVPVPTYTPPASADVRAALTIYLRECEKYEDILIPGYWNFPAPDKIPADLLIPFGEFATKYNMTAAVPQMFQVAGNALGDPIQLPTLYIMAAFGAPMARSLLTNLPTFVPITHNNTELYGKIGKLLGGDVVYNSVVQDIERTKTGVKIIVRSNDGSVTLIKAKKLLITFAQTTANLERYDLDKQERDVFSKWSYSQSMTSIVTHPSLPVGGAVTNIRTEASPSNYLVVPPLPAIGRFTYMGADNPPLFRAIIGGNETMTPDDAKQVAQSALDTVIKAGNLPTPAPGSEKLKWIAFSDHGAMHLHTNVEELKKGFITDLYALQGHRSTWYGGAGFCSQYTSLVWAFTDTLLPRLVKDMK